MHYKRSASRRLHRLSQCRGSRPRAPRKGAIRVDPHPFAIGQWHSLFVLGTHHFVVQPHERFGTNVPMSPPESSPSSLPWLPPEAWIEAFARECTEQLYRDAQRFAAWRAGAVRTAGGLADAYYVRELVQNVLADTATGVLRWEPADKTLREHVWDAIRTRTHHDRIRAKRYRHEAIDVLDPGASGVLLGEIERALEVRASVASPALAAITAERMAELRTHAAPSSPLGRLLDAFEAGAFTKADVMFLTGMSHKDYHAARLRLRRLGRERHSRSPSTGPDLKKGA